MRSRTVHLAIVLLLVLTWSANLYVLTTASSYSDDNPAPLSSPVKLIFIHHSCGENWLADEDGGLGITLRDNNYFVSDTNYEWGPACSDCSECPGSGPRHIGNCTDILHWDNWFAGPHSGTYLNALYNEFGQHSYYSRRTDPDPSRENEIIMFKSCYPNSNLGGSPNAPPTPDDWLTVGSAKAIYNQILEYFATRTDKLFVVITAPPVTRGDSWEPPANARAFNNWLVRDWLADYPHNNVAVFDFYNVLTSNGGNPHLNDFGKTDGNHHRWWNGTIRHSQTVANDLAAYASGDSHPTSAGNRKATGEFVPLLNVFYHRWQSGAEATEMPSPTAPSAPPATTPPTTAPPATTALPSGEHTVVFQQGVSPDSFYAGTADVILANDAEANANLGGTENLETFFADVEYRRFVVRFELLSLPSDITVNEASLELYRFDGDAASAMQIELYCVTRDWTEGSCSDFWPPPEYVPDGATWATAAPGIEWTSPGGDYDSTTDYGHGPNGIVDQITLPAGMENGWVRFDVTLAVQAWVEGKIPNQGLLIRPHSGEYTYHYYYSRNSSASEHRPRLVVTYIVPEESSQ